MICSVLTRGLKTVIVSSVAMAAAAAASAGRSPDQWEKLEGGRPAADAVVPAGANCSNSLQIGVGSTVLVCRNVQQAGVSIWSIASDGSGRPPRFTRLLRLAEAAGARLSWHKAPSCQPGQRCIQGVVLVDAFDDYCMGTTVLTFGAAMRPLVAGHIPELVELDGEARCIGTVATVTGSAKRAEIAVSLPLRRQTSTGYYVSVNPPVTYRVVAGRLKRERR